MEYQTIAIGGFGPVLSHRDGNESSTLGLVGDVVASRIVEDGTRETTAISGRARFGAEYEYERRFESAATLGGELELAYRGDFGDTVTGEGLEVGAKLEVAVPSAGFRMNLNARGLAAHNRDLHEWGVGGSFSWTSVDRRGRGLNIRFSPHWGGAAERGRQFWDGGIAVGSGVGAVGAGGVGGGGGLGAGAARYRLELDYGLPLAGGNHLLTLFARGETGGYDDALSLGADLKLGEDIIAGYEAALGRALSAFPGGGTFAGGAGNAGGAGSVGSAYGGFRQPGLVGYGSGGAYHRYDPNYDLFLNPFTRARALSSSALGAPPRGAPRRAKQPETDHRVYIQYEKRF